MIKPSEVASAFKKVEVENFRFRTYLKMNGSPKKIDQQFKQLHDALFVPYDCNACRNCCKDFNAEFREEELQITANHLKLDKEEMINRYLKYENGAYITENDTCNFLMDNGHCHIEDVKPEGCKYFPFTDRPARLKSMLTMVSIAEICPVVYEMFEVLKREYKFVRENV